MRYAQSAMNKELVCGVMGRPGWWRRHPAG